MAISFGKIPGILEGKNEGPETKDESMVKTAEKIGGEIRRIGIDNLDDGMIVEETPEGQIFKDNDGNIYNKEGDLIEQGQKED